LEIRHAYAYKILVGKSEGKRQLGGPGRKWKNNRSKTNLKEMGCGFDSSDSVQVTVAVSCEIGNENAGSTNKKR
jgi:hypothetical protein